MVAEALVQFFARLHEVRHVALVPVAAGSYVAMVMSPLRTRMVIDAPADPAEHVGVGRIVHVGGEPAAARRRRAAAR